MFFVRLWVAQSHSAKCFLCGKKRTQYSTNRLKRINIETLGYCYIELDKLIVKSDARVCVSHTYPNSGKIKEDHYSIHKDHLDRSTRLMSVPKESQLMFESILVYQETKYRDISMKLSSLLEASEPLLPVHPRLCGDVALTTTLSEISAFGTNTWRNCYAKNGEGRFTIYAISVL